MHTSANRPRGYWPLILITGILTVLYLLGQTMAIINYDFAVSIGLQEPEEDMTKVGIALNQGFGLGDTLVYIPLLILGITGLSKRTWWGWFCMIGGMAITVYWPVVSLATLFYAKGAPGFQFSDYTSYSILLSGIFIFGLWGLWFLYRKRDTLVLE